MKGIVCGREISMNMDLDAATKEAPTLTLDPFAEAKAEIVEKKPEELVEERLFRRWN